ncbi:hypothetical protein [Streptomyces sp. NPDC023588]|uniref:hypothetical protein n=1 Tax=Streptomyces sp. NPDC023588 TaxID=3154907 RepID=UPI0033F769E2
MRRKRLMSIAVSASSAATLALGDCSGSNNNSADSPGSMSASTSQSEDRAPTPTPKPEPNEDDDVTGARIVKTPATGEVHFACKITNHSTEESNYSIDLYAVGQHPDSMINQQKDRLVVDHVPAGKTVACTGGSNLNDLDYSDWKVAVTIVDRLSVDEAANQPDEQSSLDGINLKQKATGQEVGIWVDYALTNGADRMSSYTIKYEVATESKQVIYTSTFKTKGLDAGQTTTGSAQLPNRVLQGLDFTTAADGTIAGLTVTAVDVDRTLYQ